MPRANYNFLSEREREFLENPDSFTTQRAAEISYRIRQKTTTVKEDLELLRDTAEVWDKTSGFDSAKFVCRFTQSDAGPESFDCSNSIKMDPAVLISESLDETVRRNPEGWIVNNNVFAGDSVFAVCPECHERAIEWMEETGRVPCGTSGHRTHKPNSEPYNECKAAIPLTDEELYQPNEITGSPGSE